MSAWPAVAVWMLAASAVQLRDRRRGILAAQARHEIRGPLSAARAALEGLEGSARVQAVDLELRRAALAVDDLAHASRGRRGGGRVERVDVAALVRAAEGGWRSLAAAAGVTLVVDVPPRAPGVHADPLRLVQACGNLVANAVEHGAGPVRVRVAAAEARVRIEVADAGPGLPAPLPALLAAARGRRGARGHGLAIAASIAEACGGRLGAAPAPSGTLMTLDLPSAGDAPSVDLPTATVHNSTFARMRGVLRRSSVDPVSRTPTNPTLANAWRAAAARRTTGRPLRAAAAAVRDAIGRLVGAAAPAERGAIGRLVRAAVVPARRALRAVRAAS